MRAETGLDSDFLECELFLAAAAPPLSKPVLLPWCCYLVSHTLTCLERRKSVTAVALTSDNASVYSVSKDGSIAHVDIETGSRCTHDAQLARRLFYCQDAR